MAVPDPQQDVVVQDVPTTITGIATTRNAVLNAIVHRPVMIVIGREKGKEIEKGREMSVRKKGKERGLNEKRKRREKGKERVAIKVRAKKKIEESDVIVLQSRESERELEKKKGSG